MSAEEIPADDRAPVSAWRLLRDRSFARYFAGNLTSNVGTWFQDIAAAILVFELTGSATMVGGVAVAGYVTSLLFAPLGGQLADRFDRKRLLMLVNALQAVAAAVLAALVFVGWADAWIVLGISAAIGFGRAINTPTMHAILPSLVSERDLASATALQAITFNLARAIGPLLGALIATQFGAAAAFSVNSLSFLVFTILLVGVTVRDRKGAEVAGEGRLLDGVRYVRGRHELVVLLIVATIVGMASDPVVTLGPSFAALYGQPEDYTGWFVTAFGAGAMLAAPFIGAVRIRLGRVRTAAVAFLVIVCGFMIVALVPDPIVALAGAALSGFGYLIGSTDIMTAMQELLHDSVRGRVMAIWTMGFLGSRPIAALLDGTIADASSPRAAIAVMAAIMLVTGIALILWLRAGGARALATSRNF